MRKDEIPPDLSSQAFDFFYWFSRFEFCLKENRYLKREDDGARAEPGWGKFVQKHRAAYAISNEARALIDSPPERQVVRANGTLDWEQVGLGDCQSDLAKVVRLLKTVRNNLFHGGKHGGAGWDSPTRTRQLLSNGKAILEQLAVLGAFEDDFKRRY